MVRYEQTDPSIQYAGTWYPNYGAFNSGGSATLSMDANSTAVFSFTGIGVKWIGFSDPWSGIAQVYIDGVFKAVIDTYAADQAAQTVQYSVSNLANTAHTLTIVATGTKDSKSAGAWVWIDAFDVTTETGASSSGTGTSSSNFPPATSTPVRIEQNNPAVSYTAGTWFTNTTAGSSGGSAALCMDSGARVTLTFTGTSASWIGYRDQWSGIAQVYVDGVLQATIDTYASPAQAQSVVYTVQGLTEGNHTLAIQVVGTHDAASGGSWVWVDAFDVTP